MHRFGIYILVEPSRTLTNSLMHRDNELPNVSFREYIHSIRIIMGNRTTLITFLGVTAVRDYGRLAFHLLIGEDFVICDIQLKPVLHFLYLIPATTTISLFGHRYRDSLNLTARPPSF